MIPSLLRWCIRLQPRILNRHAPMPENPLLFHRNTVQPASIFRPRTVHRPQYLACGVDRLVHPKQLRLLLLPLLPLRNHPRTMDGPMPQRPHAAESQRPRRLRVLHVISNQRDPRVAGPLLVGLAGKVRGGGAEGSDAGNGERFGEGIGNGVRRRKREAAEGLQEGREEVAEGGV